jgi:hypothetical protein
MANGHDLRAVHSIARYAVRGGISAGRTYDFLAILHPTRLYAGAVSPPYEDEPRRDEMARSTVRVLFGFVALTLFSPVQVRAQLATGSIIGTVRDSTGAVMQAVCLGQESRHRRRAHRDD